MQFFAFRDEAVYLRYLALHLVHVLLLSLFDPLLLREHRVISFCFIAVLFRFGIAGVGISILLNFTLGIDFVLYLANIVCLVVTSSICLVTGVVPSAVLIPDLAFVA